jgi:hypothetical protein
MRAEEQEGEEEEKGGGEEEEKCSETPPVEDQTTQQRSKQKSEGRRSFQKPDVPANVGGMTHEEAETGHFQHAVAHSLQKPTREETRSMVRKSENESSSDQNEDGEAQASQASDSIGDMGHQGAGQKLDKGGDGKYETHQGCGGLKVLLHIEWEKRTEATCHDCRPGN